MITKTLINLSGGIDSTFVLYKCLKDNPQEQFLVHFCHLINYEKRKDFEYQAVLNILDWFNKKDLTNYKFIESQFDYKTLGNIIRDVELISFLTGVICQNKNNKDITQVIVSVNKDELKRYTKKFYNEELIRREKLIKLITKRYIKFMFPICEITKKEIIKEMPKELFDLCWYCRRPVDNNKCEKCHTCELVKKSI